MKRHYKNYLCLLMLLAVANSAYAQVGDIINEDFNTLEVKKPAVLTDWTFYNCDGSYNGDGNLKNFALYIKGTATTPAFNQSGNATITLSYRNSNASNDSRFTIIIDNVGKFENGYTTKQLTPLSKNTTYKRETFKLFGITNSTTITFRLDTDKKYTIIDDLVITIPSMEIDDTEADNGIVTKISNVTLSRTLAANIWNTCCLPFDVTKTSLAESFGCSTSDIELRTFSDYDSESGIMTFSSIDEIAAGTPFLIKPTTDIVDPTFTLVNVNAEASTTVTHNGVSMIGIYNQTNVGSDALFLTSSGELKQPNTDDATMKGLRAYFTAPAGARLMMSLDDATAISTCVPTATDSEKWYTLDGQALTAKPWQKGIYIRSTADSPQGKNNSKIVIIK